MNKPDLNKVFVIEVEYTNLSDGEDTTHTEFHCAVADNSEDAKEQVLSALYDDDFLNNFDFTVANVYKLQNI